MLANSRAYLMLSLVLSVEWGVPWRDSCQGRANLFTLIPKGDESHTSPLFKNF